VVNSNSKGSRCLAEFISSVNSPYPQKSKIGKSPIRSFPYLSWNLYGSRNVEDFLEVESAKSEMGKSIAAGGSLF